MMSGYRGLGIQPVVEGRDVTFAHLFIIQEENGEEIVSPFKSYYKPVRYGLKFFTYKNGRYYFDVNYVVGFRSLEEEITDERDEEDKIRNYRLRLIHFYAEMLYKVSVGD